jgi:succinate dehydrogenase/fumarate reductase flavoprotein subunit
MRKVAVIGAGAAGLAASYGAVQAGARVTLYETWERAGGTTALSGGVSWLPGHAHGEDDIDDALTYLRTLAERSLANGLDAKLVTYVQSAGPTASRLERETPLRWNVIPHPDYHGEFPGGRTQGGRSLEPVVYDAPKQIAELVRDAPSRPRPISISEQYGTGVDPEELRRREERGTLAGGRSLVAALLEACIDAGVEVRLGTRVTSLPDADAVVIASGGFERDAQLVRAFLRGPMLATAGAPWARGDGLRLAMAAGASLDLMGEAWWCPAVQIPGETIDGQPMFRHLNEPKARPHSLIVDGSGRRFIDEAQNYNDFGRALHAFDAAGFCFKHVPAWMVFDAAYRRANALWTLASDAPDPQWLIRASTPRELAEAIGVPPEVLEATLARFNENAARGDDPDFGRGSLSHDRFMGSLGSVDEPPFYALKVLPGCLGTKGGPRTDVDGRVLDAADSPIGGLYAAGNASASAFGLSYPGAGGTIGPALVFGLRAGEAAAGD